MEHIIHICPTSANSTVTVQEAFSKLADGAHNVISFEKNTYHFYSESAYHDFFFITNNTSCEKKVLFPIIDCQDLTIDGNGSTFIFHDRVTPFVIKNSKNITLKNFTIDFTFISYAQGYVTESTDDYFEMHIDSSVCAYKVENEKLYFKTADGVIQTNDVKAFSLIDITNPNVPVAAMFSEKKDYNAAKVPAAYIFAKAFKIENRVRFVYCKGSETRNFAAGDFVHINFSDRRNSVFFADHSKNISAMNIIIHRGMGMGFIAQTCTDINLDAFNLYPKQGRSEHFSVTADAIHIVHCDEIFLLKNSLISNSADDALNIHGVYSCVRNLIDEKKAEVQFLHDEIKLIPYISGDTVNMIDGETKNTIGSAVIKSVKETDNRKSLILEFDQQISSMLKEGDFIENPARMPEVRIENNIIKGCPHIRVSSSKKTRIENNVFALFRSDLVIFDLFEFWYESGVVKDVWIAHNKFVNDNVQHNIYIQSHRGRKTNAMHENIRIMNNYFCKCRSDSIIAEDCNNIQIEGNSFLK